MKIQNRKAINFLWAAIPFLALLFIFHNSMYPILQSDQQSGFIRNALNRFFYANGLPVVLTQFEVRKLAHFIEYLIFGFLLTAAIQMIREKRNGFFFDELFLFLAFPVADETIQLYSPGRGSSVSDVLIDFVSCIVGMSLCRLIFKQKAGTGRSSLPAAGKKLKETTNNCTKHLIFTAVTVLLLLFIFHNAMFSGPQSSRQSRYVMNLLNHMQVAFEIPVTLPEPFIRKAGRFTEYFALGIFMLIMVRSYRKPVRESDFAVMFFLLLVPVLDEFIQMFFIGRTGRVLDVLRDFSAGIAGMLFIRIIKNRKSRT